jgi:hypothetical protein
MKSLKLGNVGPLSSAVGLGCMGMSEFYGQSDDATSLKTLARALELGVTHFDTADTYGFGRNEALLGKFIANAGQKQRDQMVIASKFGIVRSEDQYERRIDNSPEYIRTACEASLRRLGVEKIDLYYCHRRDPAVPIEDVVATLGDLVREGKVGAIGLSEVSEETLQRAQAVHPIAAVQSEYSLWSREPEHGMLQLCEALGVAFVAYSPLGRSFLTGPVNMSGLADNDFRRIHPRFSGDAGEQNRRLVLALTELAEDLGISSSQIALAWILNKHAHVIPIPGTRRVAYLESNVQAVNIQLSAKQVKVLDELFDSSKVAGQRYPEAGFVGIERSA